MKKYLISAIALAVAPLSLAAADPSENPTPPPQTACPNTPDGHAMNQHGGAGAMPHQMGNGSAMGSGHMMQHGDHTAMGPGAHHGQGTGTMQGQMGHHGDHAAMGQGQHQATMPHNGQCPALNQQDKGK